MSNSEIQTQESDRRFTSMKAFTEALAKAQAEIGTAAKDSRNPHFNSKYADLASVWETWQEVGPKNGFAVMQLPKDAGERQGIVLKTVLMHKDGGILTSSSFFPASKNDAQAYGSALTYARRYTLAAMVGIAPDDDDGNASSAKAAPPNAGEYKEKLERAFQANQHDVTKLNLLRREADKIGYKALVSQIDGRLKEVKGEDVRDKAAE